MKFSSKCEACSLSPIRKFHPYVVAAEAAGRRVLHLNIGQPDVETPQAFFDAVRGFQDSVLAYAPAGGVDVYLEAVRDYYKSFGVSLALEEILATYGGSEALQLTAACILDDGDEVLIPEPFYPNYDTFIGVTGGKIVPIPTTAEEGYRFARREKIEPLINQRTKAIMITNPGNPTGYTFTKAELEELTDMARETGAYIVSDEIYRGLSTEYMYSICDLYEKGIVTSSTSKVFSSAGTRVGWIVTRDLSIKDALMNLRSYNSICEGPINELIAAIILEKKEIKIILDQNL